MKKSTNNWVVIREYIPENGNSQYLINEELKGWASNQKDAILIANGDISNFDYIDKTTVVIENAISNGIIKVVGKSKEASKIKPRLEKALNTKLIYTRR